MMALLKTEPFRTKCREHEDLAKSTKKYYSSVFYFCLVLGLTVDLFWGVYPVTSVESIIPFRAWFPFNYEDTVYFNVIYAVQTVAATMNTVICLNLDCFSSSMLVQAGLQCDMMSITLKNLDKFMVNEDGELLEAKVKDENKQEYSNRLLKNFIYCIKHHVEIKKYLNF